MQASTVTEEFAKIATYPSYFDEVAMVTIQAGRIDEGNLSVLDRSGIDLALNSTCSTFRSRLQITEGHDLHTSLCAVTHREVQSRSQSYQRGLSSASRPNNKNDLCVSWRSKGSHG